MGTVLTVDNINVYYGAIHAIKGISLDVNRGEIVTLIGANGAGKSTTLHTISGLLRSKTGNIEFLESSISHVPAHKIVAMGISHVPEGRRIFQGLTVEENLQMGAFVTKKDRIAHNLEYVYEQFPRLKERTSQIAGTLSGGEQQMLAMGRALMSDPELLMLDEPSMGLAPILVDQIFEIIKNLNKAGTTILLVEQNAQMALSVADRAYVIETGRISLFRAQARNSLSPKRSRRLILEVKKGLIQDRHLIFIKKTLKEAALPFLCFYMLWYYYLITF